MRFSVDLSDMEHGLDVLADGVGRGDIVAVDHCLELLSADAAVFKSTEGQELQSQLFDLLGAPADVSHVDVEQLRASLGRVAISLATAHEIAAHSAHRRRVASSSKGGRAKRRDAADRQADWLDEARRMLARNPRRTPADMARQIASQPGERASADWIAKVLRKSL